MSGYQDNAPPVCQETKNNEVHLEAELADQIMTTDNEGLFGSTSLAHFTAAELSGKHQRRDGRQITNLE